MVLMLIICFRFIAIKYYRISNMYVLLWVWDVGNWHGLMVLWNG
ncbi:hypothetical protein [Candidatus Hodgkinia cicadicola]